MLELEELSEKLNEFHHNEFAWQHLAGDYGLLLHGLEDGVERGDPSTLERCWELFSEIGPDQIARYYKQDPNRHVNVERLYRNARGLIKTAQIAAEAKQAASHPNCTNICERLVVLTKEASSLLGRRGQGGEVELGKNYNNAIELVNSIYDALSSQGWGTQWARFWTLYWLKGFRPLRSLQIPLVGCYRRKGFLAYLHLHLLNEEGGELIEDPEIALRPLGDELLKALLQAWSWTEQGVWWKITAPDKEGIPASLPLDGASLGGAATVGFLLLRDGRPYDRRCVIIARVNRNGNLKKVAHEREKVEAARQHGLKRIIVSKDAGVREDDSQEVEVIGVSNVSEALDHASMLVVRLSEYYTSIIDWPSRKETLPPYLGGRDLARLYVEPNVKEEAESPSSSPMKPVAWREEFQRLKEDDQSKFVVIIGPPGQGKSLLAQMTARELAQQGWNELREGARIDQLPLPIIIPLRQLLNLLRGSPRPRSGETLRRHLRTVLREILECDDTDVLLDYLARHVHEERVWLFLDAAEVEEDQGIWDAFKDWSCHIIITLRPYGYKELPSDAIKYTLAPFSLRQMKSFLYKWWKGFPGGESQIQRIWNLLRDSPSIQQICENPFLLTLLNWVLEQSNVPHLITRTLLYERMILDLLGFLPNGAGRDERRAIELLPMLSHIAWECFQNSGLQPIPLKGLRRLIAESEDRPIPCDPTRGERIPIDTLGNLSSCQQADLLIQELESKRVLVPVTGQPLAYAFPHSSFFEYLAAHHLAENSKQLDIVWQHWLDSNWGNIFPFLVGSQSDPAPILRKLVALIQEEQHPLHRQQLASILQDCILECQRPLEEDSLRRGVFDALLALVDSAQKRLGEREWRALGNPREVARLLVSVERHYGSEAHASSIREILGDLGQHRGRVSLEFVERLTDALRSPAAPVRWAALWGLVSLRGEQAESLVKDRLLNDESPIVRAQAARALVKVQLDKQNVFCLLKDLLKDRDAYVRGGVASALGRLGDPEAIPLLEPYASPHKEPNPFVRSAAMWALQNLASRATLAEKSQLRRVFLEGLSETWDPIVTSAINGLVNINCVDAWKELARMLLESESPAVRKTVAWALGQLKVPEAVPSLIKSLKDENIDVLTKSLEAILRCDAFDAALSQLKELLGKSDASLKFHLFRVLWNMSESALR